MTFVLYLKELSFHLKQCTLDRLQSRSYCLRVTRTASKIKINLSLCLTLHQAKGKYSSTHS